MCGEEKVKLHSFRKGTVTEKRLIEQIIDSKFTVTKGQRKWQSLFMDC